MPSALFVRKLIYSVNFPDIRPSKDILLLQAGIESKWRSRRDAYPVTESKASLNLSDVRYLRHRNQKSESQAGFLKEFVLGQFRCSKS